MKINLTFRKNIVAKSIFFLSVFCLNSVGFSQDWNELIKTTASDREQNDEFGWGVAIDGDYAVVGAYGDDEDENGLNPLSLAGSAYVLEKDGAGNWVQVQKIVASDRSFNDYFGRQLAISGDYLVVGVTYEDEDENGLNTMSAAGSAYIFERNGAGIWVEVQKIVASDRAANDYFGHAIDLSGDRIVVGAFYEDEDESGLNTRGAAGSAYVFERDGSGYWNQVQKLVASDRYYNDWFGKSVSIDGDQIAVCALQERHDENGLNQEYDAGSVYIFNRDGSGVWSETQKIVASDRDEQDEFGKPVVIVGDYLVAGAYKEDHDASGANTLSEAGSVYVFKKDGSGTWSQVQKLVASDRALSDRFSSSLDMSDGYIVVGSYQEDEDTTGSNTLSMAGSIYIFEENGAGVWQEVQKSVASDRNSDDCFGFSLAISGNTIITGAYHEDEDATGANSLSNAGSVYLLDQALESLPIELTYFNALSIKSSVELDWQTNVEINNDFFTVERSIDGVLWQELIKLDGAGNSTSQLEYYTTDYHPHLGTSYYRLKQTDFDGSSTYSAIQSVYLYSNIEAVIYPNPFSSLTTLEFDSDEQIESIVITDMLGKIVKQISINSRQGRVNVDLSEQPAGVYVARLGELKSIKLIKE